MTVKIFRHFSEIATLENAYKKDGRKLSPSDLGLIKDASIVYNHDEIIWVGPDSQLPEDYQHMDFIDASGKTCVPEIVDSHTHVVFGGDRAHEYSMRLNGATYEEIAKAGGGILNSMKGTNALSRSELLKLAQQRIKNIRSYGVGTIEVKSGYGLNFEKEYEISRIIHDLKNIVRPDVQIINTFMAAHAVPKDYSSSYEYMKDVVLPLLDKLGEEQILDCVDIFHEQNYFSEEDVISLFERAKRWNIPVKMHADEFNDNKGAILATKYQALSADHLLATGADGIEALKNSNTVATLLPGTGLFLGKNQANGRAFLDAGVKVAIASDYNPGSCHCDNLVMIASLAAPIYKMNMAELWCAITFNAACAVGLKNQGALIPGLRPRFSVFNTDSIDRITYNWGKNLAI
ncbi:imidazolonepropionase [Bacteriovorax stolpii]|uniref:Imidazolonepropionase n=1 Tax=Bacteriovorax stolpii TaxID=960 RepID=A0A2K9NX64_BACTC|nr:imidazolonepropionase [Bacteriovorax stolpii]AUO00114.1 imidazolonepropionase [Bacteriovorax stolpii]QDK39895.1 imidazolonepropionase [Bacteriovorax stolpii]TDP53994.1 imidazolonepropionase [Bacteriovorax stolpii]